MNRQLFKVSFYLAVFALLTFLPQDVLSQVPDPSDLCGDSNTASVELVSITPAPAADGSFPDGTVIEVCYNFTYDNPGGAQFIHGIVLDLPDAVDPSSISEMSPLFNCTGANGSWDWYDSVTGTGSGDTYGPGWFFDGAQSQDGNPGNNWGESCSGITFGPLCFEMALDCGTGLVDGSIIMPAVYFLGDGDSGSWGIPSPCIPYAEPTEAGAEVAYTVNCCDAEPGIPPSEPVQICENGDICLFDLLTPVDAMTPVQDDGVWIGPGGWTWDGDPACANFDPTTDPPGDYSYTVTGSDGCLESVVITMEYTIDPIVGSIAYCGGGLFNLYTEVCVPEGLPVTGTWYYPGATGYPSFGAMVPFGDVDSDSAAGGEYVYQYYDSNNCFTTTGVNLIFATGGVAGCETFVDVCTTDGDFCPFDVLGCNPEPGGQWIVWDGGGGFVDFYATTAGCASQADLEDWYVNNGGVMRFEYVLGAFPCDPAYTDVHVTIHEPVNTGVFTSQNICVTDPPVLLETLLDDGGTPLTPGLNWDDFTTPSSGIPLTNPLDPSAYPPNTTLQLQYSGGLAGTSCENATLLSLTILPADAEAGDNAIVDVCSNDGAIDMFPLLGPTAQTGGEWTGPAPFAAGPSGFYNPAIHNPGVYTYTITTTCDTDFATVTVNELTPPDAGFNNFGTACDADGVISHADLTAMLGGTPDAGGAWTDQATGLPIADPLDISGACGTSANYQYTVDDGNCTNSSVLILSVDCGGDAGPDVNIDLCEDPALNVTLVPDPAADAGGSFNSNGFPQVPANSGVYTYTVPGSGTCPDDVADYIVNIDPEITYSVTATCEPNQTQYEVIINVLSGNVTNVTGGPGNYIGSTFTSGLIGAGTPYSFTLVSGGSCSDVVVSGASPACFCPVTADITSTNTTICEATCTDISIALAGGTPPYSITYDDGTGPQTVNSIFTSPYLLNVCPTTNTTYTLTDVSDANCVGTANGAVTISVDPAPNAGADGTLDYCADGAIVNFPPPTGADAGNWSPSGSVPADAANSGTYQYIVPGGACPDDVSDWVVTFDPEIQYTVDAVCQPNQTQYITTITVTAGDVSSVTGLGTWDGTNNIFTSDLINVGTNYSFTLVSGGACPDVVVSGSSPACACPATADFNSPNTTICNGDCYDIEVVFGGGVPPYSFTYDDGTGLQTVNGIFAATYTLQVCPVANTTYTLTDMSDANCIGTANGSVTVQVETPPNAGVDGTLDYCADGSIVNLPQPPGSGSGSWSPSGAVTADVANSGTFQYTVNGTACPPAVSDWIVTFEPEITYSVNAACEPNQTEFGVDIDVLTGGYIEIIDNSNGLASQPAQPGVHSFGPIPAGTNYSFTIVSDGSCPDVIVSGVSPVCSCPATADINSPNTTICEGDCYDIEVVLGGGIPPYSFTYDDGTGPQTVNGIFASPYLLQVCPTANTTYTLTDMSDANCIGTANGSVTVQIETAPDAGPDVTVPAICGDGTVLNPDTYLDPGVSTSGTWSTDPIPATPANSGTYSYTLTGTECPADVADYTFTFDPQITYNVLSVACEPSQTEYVVQIEILTGVGPFSVDGVPIVGNIFTSSTITAGTPYSFDISDSGSCGDVTASGASPNCNCSTEATFTTANTTICDGDCINLEGNLIGTPPFTVVINDGTADITINSPTNTFSYNVCPTATTTYTMVSAEDANCIGSAFGSVTITVDPIVNAGPANVIVPDICGDGATVILNSLLDPTAQTGGSWTDPLGNPLSSVDALSANSGIYTYTINGGACPDAVATYNITFTEDLTVTAISATCEPNQTEYNVTYVINGGSGNYTITDNVNGAAPVNGTGSGYTFQTSSAIPIGSGYNFTVTDGLCADVSVSGIAPNCNCPATASFVTTNTTICETDCIDLELSFQGDAPYTFEYTDGTTTFPPIVSPTATYMLNVCPTATTTYSLVSVEDANCVGSAFGSVTITVDGVNEAGNPVSITECGDGSNLALNGILDPSADTGGTWTDPLGATVTSVLALPANSGIYTYTVSGGSCPDDQASYTITFDPEIEIGPITAVCEPNQEEYSVQFDIIEGVPGYTVTGNTMTPPIGNTNVSIPPYTFNSGLIDFDTNPTYSFEIADNGSCGNLQVGPTAAPDCNCIAQGSITGSTAICESECTDIQFNLIGDAPFNVVYEDGNGNQFPLNGIQNGHLLSVCPAADQTYTLVSVEDSYCEGTVTGTPVNISVDDQLSVSLVSYMPSFDNESYQVVLSITGGDPSTYNFSPAGGFYDAATQTYTSFNIPCGQTSSITIGDAGVCNDVVFDANYVCQCVSDAGSIANTPQTLCSTETLTVTHFGDEVMDGNDVLEFILHTGTDGSLGAIIDRSSTGVFDLSSYSLTPGTTYCVMAAVGDNDFTGSVNLDDECTSLSSCLLITVEAPPTASISGGAAICPGETVDITIVFTGTPPYDFTYSDGTNTTDATANTNSFTITTGTPGTYSVVSVDDNNCSGTTSGSATVTNYAVPSATMSGNPNICENSGDGPIVSFTGNGPWTFSYTIDGGEPDTITSNTPSVVIPAEVGGLYELVSMEGTYCTGTVSGSLQVVLNQQPTAIISGGGEVCDGDEAVFVVQSTGTGPWQVLYTVDGVVQAPQIIDDPYHTFSSGESGEYIITSVSDANCSGIALDGDASLVVNPIPDASLMSDVSAFCLGQEVEVDIELEGNAPFTLTYVLDGDTITQEGISGGLTRTLIPDGPINAELLFIEDSSNPTCSTDLNETLYVDAQTLPNAPVLQDDSLCLANGPIQIGVLAAPGLSYEWMPEERLSDPKIPNPIFTPGAIGPAPKEFTYVITATDGECSASDTMTVTVDPGPTARFSWSPDPVLSEDTEVFFQNNTIGYDNMIYFWEFDTLGTTEVENPSFKFPDGINDDYLISLTAIDLNTGCMDDATELLTVEPDLLMYVPNAFTPDEDGLNDVWGPIMKNIDPDDYRLTVMDRFGQIIFETRDPEQKWNGSINGGDHYARPDLYIWLIETKNVLTLDEVEFSGKVQLIR